MAHICAGTRPHLRRDPPVAHICAGTRHICAGTLCFGTPKHISARASPGADVAWDDRDRAVACNSYDRPAEFILLVEKDAAFMRLAEDRFYNRHAASIIGTQRL